MTADTESDIEGDSDVIKDANGNVLFDGDHKWIAKLLDLVGPMKFQNL
ncbi:hypothetical protein KO561_19590 [Radiobacillus kanasensis]|nr:hypothetical protein KO561_19590 [Radiobacillus kanasensis]